ncbi:cytochrome d ubiquinol oxidase subunit II [Streptomyces gilvus]|uniref:cytochrome d ubiquinol oxidase subunit II n=1 Tax=Streptomyces gilvus TaxID=2920937 RepID=UPI001F112B46|nr:cytochrome d ubiquinol oxidase subunit II [Streptomyces sp. CME 23]MCH5670868.1 cytochrome d ubiquinol oxidase subunit II [Streptomyces sp. CME 23]
MGYATLWLCAFGVLFTGYLVLAGIDYGVGLVLPHVAREDGERRLALNAVGPFFLGNEVWLLVAVGTMIGTLPGLESRLLTGAYPLAIVAMVGVVVVNVSVQLRSRSTGSGARSFWDAVVFGGAAAAAFGWGALLAALAGGVDLDAAGSVTGSAGSVTPLSLLGGVTAMVLFAAHGAVFLTARAYGAVAERARRAVPVLSAAAGLLLLATLVVAMSGGLPDGAFRHPVFAVVALLGVLAVLAVAVWCTSRAAAWQAFAASATAVALAPVAVVAGKYPALITPRGSGLRAPATEELAGSSTSLALITWTAGPVLLLVIAVQAYAWWIFRGRMTSRSPVFY